MDWLSILLFAACPLMMLFCMKGMFSSNQKDKHSSAFQSESNEIQAMNAKMADLLEQNEKLMKEVESIKQNNNVTNSNQNHVS